MSTRVVRCPACQTAFKVTPEQLAVANGMVRCGHCQQVFGAGGPGQGTAPGDAPTASAAKPVPASAPSAPATQVLSFLRDNTPSATALDAWLRRPRVQLGLKVALGVLVLALGLQWLLYARDRLAANDPSWQPVLNGLCAPFGCEVAPLRELQALRIESTVLQRRVPDQFVFELVLKNTAPRALATPAVELSLTDASGQLLVRRVLLPSDWQPPAAPALPAGAESPLQVAWTLPPATAQAMSNYRALLFYP